MVENVAEDSLQMSTKMVCKSCAAEFTDDLSKCPYCGSMNIKGAEAEYMGKLQDVKEDLGELSELPEQARKKELKKQVKRWGIVAAVILVLAVLLQVWFHWSSSLYIDSPAKERADMLWLAEREEELNTLYENNDAEGILEYFYVWCEEENAFSKWEHWNFATILHNIKWARDNIEYEAKGNELSRESLEDLFYNQCVLKGLTYRDDLTDEEKEKLLLLGADILQDYETRWGFSPEGHAKIDGLLQEWGGYVRVMEISSIVKDWYER